MRPDHRRHCAGFTLLEVLVALVIVSLGMIAVFGQVNQSVAATSFLRNKTLAHWIAVDRITELRINREFPSIGEHSDEIEAAHARWITTVKISATPAENLRRIDVSVAFVESPDSQLAAATGFIGRPMETGPPGSPGQGPGNPPSRAGWFPLDPNNLFTPGAGN